MLRKLGAMILVLMLSSCAGAETFNVTNANSTGSGSLAWAVNSVNASETSGHFISFDRTVKNIVLAQELTINKSVTINGGGATLEGSGRGRLFTITNGHTAFNKLTFTKGYAVSDNGGAVKVEGSSASAEFNNCTFYDNIADNYGGAVCVTNGGANPRTSLTHCTLAGNRASNGGGFAIIRGEAAIFASIVLGNTNSNDIYRNEGATLNSYYNILGTSNTDTGSNSLTGRTANEVLLTDSQGNFSLAEINGVEVLKLSGTSIARDFISDNSGYNFDSDETGNIRPMLNGYDAGAVEASPVPVQSIDISGLPYIQINGTDTYTIKIYPEDASRNTKDYPPEGIVWQSSNTSVLSVDKTGKVQAVGVGTTYLTAQVHGWNSDGTSASKASNALQITVGQEVRRSRAANMAKIDDVVIGAERYSYVKPVVSVDINGILIRNTKGGTDYSLTVVPARLDVVTAEIVSGDTIRLLAGTAIDSCDVTVTARPLPEGDAVSRTFSVSVTEDGTTNGDSGVGRSSGGGGCDSMMTGASLLALLYILRRKS